jgi:hypothetical protein
MHGMEAPQRIALVFAGDAASIGWNSTITNANPSCRPKGHCDGHNPKPTSRDNGAGNGDTPRLYPRPHQLRRPNTRNRRM